MIMHSSPISNINQLSPKSFGKMQCHLSWQRMDSPAACASCAMPTTDESNYSAASTLYPHYIDRHTSLSKALELHGYQIHLTHISKFYSLLGKWRFIKLWTELLLLLFMHDKLAQTYRMLLLNVTIIHWGRFCALNLLLLDKPLSYISCHAKHRNLITLDCYYAKRQLLMYKPKCFANSFGLYINSQQQINTMHAVCCYACCLRRSKFEITVTFLQINCKPQLWSWN